jgi:ubiquinone/menaquinone biosynthesis C-methylase UbiE/DNA-binding transcriptional ArsR family regulator
LSASPERLALGDLLSGLRAAGEDTRLRLLALLAEGELTVSDLTDILGQSQPRISRHLKLMGEAGLLERHREGAWAFFKLAESGAGGALAHWIVERLDDSDPLLAADKARLAAVRAARTETAQLYFDRHAADWDRIRSLHAPDEAVEQAIRQAVGNEPVGSVLDLGTGTGRMLALLSPQAKRLTGVDANHAMLAVARANLEAAGLRRVELRQGDIHAPPVERDAFDLVMIHQVLHFLDDPARALREAAALLAPGGRILIVDFAPHGLEFLREAHAHRRLGFAHEQMRAWLAEAGLDCEREVDLAPPEADAERLTVSLWLGRDRRPKRVVSLEKEVA